MDDETTWGTGYSASPYLTKALGGIQVVTYVSWIKGRDVFSYKRADRLKIIDVSPDISRNLYRDRQ